jgi:hypothetical protein
MGVEPTIPVLKRAKTIHAFDRATTVIDTDLLFLKDPRMGNGTQRTFFRKKSQVSPEANLATVVTFRTTFEV